jgi:hypothetical protein
VNLYQLTLVIFLGALVTMLAAAWWTGRSDQPKRPQIRSENMNRPYLLLRPVPDPAGSAARCARDPWPTVPFPVADDWVAWSDIRAGWDVLERQQRGWSA